MLQLKDFCKVYPNGKVGAKDINLQIDNGDIYAFIGHNGAGKTTTLKCIAGILDITSGDIMLDNVSVKDKPMEVKSKLAYIPDNPDIYGSLTGIQYINFVSDIYNVSKEKRMALTEQYAKMLEIYNDLNTPISAYSHGMRQKVVLVASLVHEPKLLIMDEPFVGLDPKASFELKTIMKDFVSNGGTIFFSSHVLEVVEKLCNKVAIIKNGEIITSGTMKDIKKDKTLEQVFLGVDNE